MNGGQSGQDDNEPSFIITESEQVEIDRERIFLQFNRYNPAYAILWLEALNRAIVELSEFPGPRAHPIDDRASSQFQCEIRSLLFQGPRSRRSRAAHHVLYTILPPNDENIQTIRILRILHATRGTIEEAAETDIES